MQELWQRLGWIAVTIFVIEGVLIVVGPTLIDDIETFLEQTGKQSVFFESGDSAFNDFCWHIAGEAIVLGRRRSF